MPKKYTCPGVHIEEVPSEVRTIAGVSTSIAAFMGYTKRGPINQAEQVLSYSDFKRIYGGLDKDSPVSYATQQYFMNGGQHAYVVRITDDNGGLPNNIHFLGNEAEKTGIHSLLDVDLFNILCLPGIYDLKVLSVAVSFCEKHRAFMVIDCPEEWQNIDNAFNGISDYESIRSENAAMYFPWIQITDPLDDNRKKDFPPCGVIAGIYAKTDSERGVWKAPAGQEAKLSGVKSLVYRLTDNENGMLNPLGLNCLRTFPVVGPIIWGARTLKGADVLASEWKYIPVRRMALFIEESLYRGTQWIVFEPNDEPLWAQIRLNVGTFMHNLFRQGAFQGAKPKDAYFVKCDGETTTQADRDLGIVNILVGFAPLTPAEFVVIKITQMRGKLGENNGGMEMAQFSANTSRFDPYKNFKFRVKWDGKYVVGISKITSGLQPTIEPVEHREGGDPNTKRKLPGPIKYEAITLERGVTHDPEFDKWANMIHNYKGDAAMSFKKLRKDVRIELLDEKGDVVLAYNLYHCWVSEYQALPDLDAGGDAVAIQKLKIENEGWEIDKSIKKGN